jgi:isoquinoline 1-oxidoreductase beta subunit
MNYMPKIDRRASSSAAAAAAGSRSARASRFGADVDRAQDGTPEINAWVVIRPTTRRDPHRALRDGPGLAHRARQLVAEELDATGRRYDRISDPGQNVARKRVWGDFAPSAAAHPRVARIRAQGRRAAREMLMQAAANEWKVPVRVSAANGVITHKASGRTTTYGNVAERAKSSRRSPLKDRRMERSAGKPLKRLDTPTSDGSTLRHRLHSCRHAVRRDQGLPGVRRQGQELRCARSGMRVQKVVQVGDMRRGRRDPGGRPRPRSSAADRVGRRTQRQGPPMRSSPVRAASTREAFVGNKSGDAKARSPRGDRRSRAVYSYPYQNHATMEPMNATARYTAGQVRGLDQLAERRGRVRPRPAGSRPAGRKCDVYNTLLGGGFGRRARSEYVSHAVRSPRDAGHADQAASSRAKTTLRTASITRSRSASSSALSTPTTT